MSADTGGCSQPQRLSAIRDYQHDAPLQKVIHIFGAVMTLLTASVALPKYLTQVLYTLAEVPSLAVSKVSLVQPRWALAELCRRHPQMGKDLQPTIQDKGTLAPQLGLCVAM